MVTDDQTDDKSTKTIRNVHDDGDSMEETERGNGEYPEGISYEKIDVHLLIRKNA